MVKSGWIGSSILVQSFLHYLKTKVAVIYKLAHWFFWANRSSGFYVNAGLADWSIPFDISIFQNVFQAGYNGLLDRKYSAS